MWKSIIDEHGIGKVAKEIPTSYESVRRWVRGLALPEGDNLKSLCRIMQRDLGEKWQAFFASLVAELTGIEK